MFFFNNRALRAETLLHSRSVAPSGLRPLWKIPYCCLPQEYGPCLSPIVADQSLNSAMHHRLGRPLPHQQANAPQVHPRSDSEKPSFKRCSCEQRCYAVLASVSKCCPRFWAGYLRVTHPSATRWRPKSIRCKHHQSIGPTRSTCMY